MDPAALYWTYIAAVIDLRSSKEIDIDGAIPIRGLLCNCFCAILLISDCHTHSTTLAMPLFWNRKAQASAPTSPVSETSSLHTQLPTPASVETKIHLSFAATAWLDALGAPQDSRKRGSFPFVTTMLPNENFNFPPGVWTDDTSMMLCLAHSISTYQDIRIPDVIGGFDEVHQMEQYRLWHKKGVFSATDECFEIATTIRCALEIFTRFSRDPGEALHRIRSDLGGERCSGNGSLMRVLPIGLAYWRDESQAKQYAKRSSQTTHPSVMCTEACEMWTCAIARIMEATTQPSDNNPQTPFSKLSLLEFISTFPYTSTKLHQSLTVPFIAPPRPESRVELEQYYYRYHPLLRLVSDTQGSPGLPNDSKFPYCIPTEDQLPTTISVADSLVAALYCFFTTKTFEEGALMAVNLGDGANTVGVVYAGLAACWYAAAEGKADRIFWTRRVKEWRRMSVRSDVIAETAQKLLAYEQRMSSEYAFVF